MTLPDSGPETGEAAHFRALESLYAAAPINRLFESRLEIPAPGVARIHFIVDSRYHHAAGAAHGTAYFKMLDDAAFYAANSLVTDRFLLTTAFKTPQELRSPDAGLLPQQLNLDNFTSAVDKADLYTAAGNSLLVAVTTTAIVTAVSLPAAYAQGRKTDSATAPPQLA